MRHGSGSQGGEKKKGLPAEAGNPLIYYRILVPTAGFELAT
jgi:hypothetical protein